MVYWRINNLGIRKRVIIPSFIILGLGLLNACILLARIRCLSFIEKKIIKKLDSI